MWTEVKTNAKVLIGSKEPALFSHVINVWTTAVFTAAVREKYDKKNRNKITHGFWRISSSYCMGSLRDLCAWHTHRHTHNHI